MEYQWRMGVDGGAVFLITRLSLDGTSNECRGCSDSSELKAAGTPWVGSFLLKDQKSRTEGSQVLSAPEGEGSELLRGKELYRRLQEHGTFAQITNVMRPLDGEGASQVLFMGHRRLRIFGMQSISTIVEVKMTGDQRKHFLMEAQLKAMN